MASYLELAQLMDKKDEQAENLANELTIKDMISILNNPDSTPVEIEVVTKAAQLLTEAENDYVARQENGQTVKKQDRCDEPSNEELQRLARQLFGKGE